MATFGNEPNKRLRAEPITKENHNRVLKETHEGFVAPEGFQAEGELCDYRFCSKNPGHVGFIPVDQFCIDHVPPGHKRKLVFEWIKSLAAVTVRIKSTYVSDGRPDNYPFDQYRGEKITHYGTGRLFTSGVQNTPCPCKDCGGKRGTACYSFWIETAKHVIYDATEAKHATVDVYFDKAGPPSATLTGMEEEPLSAETTDYDFCNFFGMTHDLEISERLDKDVKRFNEVWNEIQKEVKEGLDIHYLPIVSHPHGFHKHVSLGDVKDPVPMDGNPNFTCHYYTTPTCPGSSGATINPWIREWYLFPHVHHGHDPSRKENRSGFTWAMPGKYVIEDVESTPTTMGKKTNFNKTDLSSFLWYHGNVGRDEAERKVKDLGREGTFLVRESSHPNGEFPYILVVFHEGNVYNIEIRCREDSRFALGKKLFYEWPSSTDH